MEGIKDLQGLKASRLHVTENITDMTYKLDKNKTAFVLAGTVRHLCGELQKKRKNIYKVPLNENMI